MRRHLAIINELEAIRASAGMSVLQILDFGGADGSLARALDFYGIADRYGIVLVDVDEEVISDALIAPPVRQALAISPSGPLPFGDGAFDVVVSSDVFEHIPRAARAHWAAELRRVARLGQIHTMPADSADGRWVGTATDRAWTQWRDREGLGHDLWTDEHLENGLPDIREIEQLFAPCAIRGISNAAAWLSSMKAQERARSPVARARFTARYMARLRRLESQPPFKNCLVVAAGSLPVA